DVPVTMYAAAWENLFVWLRRPDPDWSALEPWKNKWMDVSRSAGEDGLSGVVHYLGLPTAEGGGFFYEVDFGSAPVAAAMELLDALVDMGASEIELGRADGSKLPAAVREELQKPELPMDRLSALVAGLLAELPEVESVSPGEDAETLIMQSRELKGRHRLNLGNLHRLLHRVGVEQRAFELSRYLRGQRETLAPMPAADLSQLRIVVKNSGFIDQIRKLGPKMKPLVSRHVIADLWLACVWDAPNGMRFATEEDAEIYGLSTDEMLDRAQANFLKTRPPPEVTEIGPIVMAQTNDCYDASLLIDGEWLNEMESKWKGGMLACVPARHVLLLGDAGQHGAAAKMREAARQIEGTGDHLISSTILRRRGGEWEPYQESPPPPLPTAKPPPPAAKSPPPKKAWWRLW
ncbi:MAG TPA: DUF1444 family protein, partial [Tepidisphaeraceae bacterium]|nr:DUF1444 family protein [Tepidisphaeraceae bacterium]